MTETSIPHRPIRSFVLREGRFTSGQAKAYQQLWTKYGCEFTPDLRFDPNQCFATLQPLYIEIGFGNGETLAEFAIPHPEWNFLGIEVHRPGIGRLLRVLSQNSINNVRIVQHDAVPVINALPHACTDGIYLLFPDPWPKLKHRKRRLVQPNFVSAVASILRPGGFWYLATDWEDYAFWMLKVLNNCPDLCNSALDGGFAPASLIRPKTRFERRGQLLGHNIYELRFYKKTF
ncbi:hypothetical protein TI05_03025 [Achromatium sp. WMS3]|nr:hypothetical protein TI05_03025 [Achromatium sp. WMS3]